MPVYTSEVDGIGVLKILEAIRLSGQIKTCKLYQASTSELFGKVREVPQNENTLSTQDHLRCFETHGVLVYCQL